MINSQKIKYFFALLFLTAIIITGNSISASAQDGETRQRESFLKYLVENPDYNAVLDAQIEKVFKMTFPSCETVEGSKRVKPKIIVPPHFYNENARAIQMNIDVMTMHPEYGQWIDKMIVRGCKQTIDFRSNNLDSFDNLEKNSIDFYASLRSLYLQDRENKIKNNQRGRVEVIYQNEEDWEEIDSK